MISQRRHVVAIILGLLFTVATALVIVALVALPNLRQGSPILTPDGERAVQRAKQQAKKKPAAAAGTTWHGLVAFRHRLARLHRRISRAWAPVSAVLHEGMDRLEARDAAKDNSFDASPATPSINQANDQANDHGNDRVNGTKAGTPIRHAAGPSRSAALDDQRLVHDQALAAGPDASGRPAVGRPRPVPPISGPIPEVAPHDAGAHEAGVHEAGVHEADTPEGGAREAAQNGTGPAVLGGADEADPDGGTIDLRDRSAHPQRSNADQRAGSVR